MILLCKKIFGCLKEGNKNKKQTRIFLSWALIKVDLLNLNFILVKI